MLKIFKNILIGAVLVFAPISCYSNSESDKKYTSFISPPPGGIISGPSYTLFTNNEKFYLMVISGTKLVTNTQKDKRREVAIYDIEDGRLVKKYTDKNGPMGSKKERMKSINSAVQFLESKGFKKTINPLPIEPVPKSGNMKDSGDHFYQLGSYKLVALNGDVCSSELEQHISIWSDSEGAKVDDFVLFASGDFLKSSPDTCEKMRGHDSETLGYISLSVKTAWQLDSGNFGIALTSYPGFLLFNEKNLVQKPSATFPELKFLDYVDYYPFYKEYKSECYVSSDTYPTTLDNCISDRMKEDERFQYFIDSNEK